MPRLMRWVSGLMRMICTFTVSPTLTISLGWFDAAPCHVGDMQQAVDTAEIDKRAVVGDVLDHAVDHLALFEAGDDLTALLGPGLLEHRAARDDDIAAPAIHLENLEGLRRIHKRTHVADRPDVDLAAGKKRHRAIEIDREAALHAVEDHALDLLVGFVFLFEPDPTLFAARFFTRQHGFAGGVLDALEIDVDLIADGKFGGAAREAEFFQGNAAFGLQADVYNRHILFDAGGLCP